MGVDSGSEDRAYEALAQHPRIADLVALTRSLMSRAVEARRGEVRPEQVAEVAVANRLVRDDTITELGNVMDVLGRGPSNDAEQSLVCALAAHVVARHPPQNREDQERVANDLLWLAAHTSFDATGLIDRALGEGAGPVWNAVGDRVRRIDEGQSTALGRGEALVGALALASSRSSAAAAQVSALAAHARDPKLARALAGARSAGDAPPLPAQIVGEFAPAPRSPAMTVVLALTGVLLVLHTARAFGRIALAYRRPAEIRVSDDGGVRVHWRTEVLGRTLGDRDVLVPRSGLAQATREVRYPRLALYAGLLALAVGTYTGVSAFVDGVRAASPSLLGAGLLVVILGLAADFVLSSIAPGMRGRCRVLVVPRTGRRLCVGGVDVQAADAILARIAHS
jgi:hypothetical protein